MNLFAHETLAVLVLGPVQLARPEWLLLIPTVGLLVIWIARKNLSGLMGWSRRAAVLVRLLVVALIAFALAEPSRRDVSDRVAVVAVVDASRSIPRAEQEDVAAYVEQVRSRADEDTDLLGVVSVARDATVQSIPSRLTRGLERGAVGATDASNLAAGVRMAIAVAPEDAANRVLLISDGNETAGSLLAAAEAARAASVPVDVLPVEYDYPAEVIVDRLVAPSNARGGETLNLSVVVTATAPARGRLVILQNGSPLDLDESPTEVGQVIELDEGKNVLTVAIEPRTAGPQSFEAVFEPFQDGRGGYQGDSVVENNRASAVTFVGSEGSVLLIGDDPVEYGPLQAALLESEINVTVLPPTSVPETLTELSGFEAIFIPNQPAGNFSEALQEAIRQYVHDSGGGLIMTGGPNSFGAGGWIGSPLEDALPVRLDPPQRRQMPRGALVLVIHSVEAPNGVYWGKQTALAAVGALSRLDLAGIVEYTGFAGQADFVHPLLPVGDGLSLRRAVNNLRFGDMQTFTPSMNITLQQLQAAQAGQKHVIVISDGDPSLDRNILGRYRQAGISISTVGVFPHSPGDFNTLRQMAQATGGNFYPVTTQAGLATLPQIFIKEAQTVRRSLIWEGDAFSPALTGVPTETTRGISAVPPISGYVVTTKREGLAVTTLQATQRVGEGQQAEIVEDPIAAQWQYGLGRVMAFTSDASTRWASAWTSWGGFRQFWEQHARWAMRPAGSANVRVITERRGDQTVLIVDALDEAGERLNFARFQGRLATPDGEGAEIAIQQVGPGRYEGVVETPDSGSYVATLTYRAPGQREGAPELKGSVQAAIAKPFADEFRALTTNESLLRQVATITGGEVLTRDPEADEPWRREGLTEPVALSPIWLAVAISAIGLFLADVGIRRVRIDLGAIAASIGGLFGRAGEKQAGQDLGALRTARARTRERYDDRPDTAKRKFEAPEDMPLTSGPVALKGEQEEAAIPGLSKPERAKASDKGEGQEGDGGGMSALLAAKRRAREQQERDET
ncbi:MAG: VWA domain-containing protein [Planctomycetota bacterium]